MSIPSFPRSETLYLHLRPGRYQRDLSVTKMAKSPNAEVEPGTVIAKVRVTVPADFFKDVLPTAELTLTAANVEPVIEVTPAREEEQA